MGGVTIGKYQGGNQDYSGSGATNPLGRWPANFIHDGSEEVVALFPQSNGGAFPKKSNVPTGKHYEGGWGAVDNGVRTEMDNGSAARFFYCAKASKADRGENHHPTVKPTDLMRYLCRLVTPPSGIVLDPFMGSGSTGKAAMLEGFAFVGIEREAEYIDIAKARIQSAVGLL
jgi:site-specific DNA-methyltransferase (adenine-specific)